MRQSPTPVPHRSSGGGPSPGTARSERIEAPSGNSGSGAGVTWSAKFLCVRTTLLQGHVRMRRVDASARTGSTGAARRVFPRWQVPPRISEEATPAMMAPDATTTPVLHVQGLKKHFPVPRSRGGGKVHAVDGVDLTISAGEVLGLVGG